MLAGSIVPEARAWLTANPNESALASNRFGDTENAKRFIEHLYNMGAVYVGVFNIYDEPWRIESEGGPYADTLYVLTPEDDPDTSKELADIALAEGGPEGVRPDEIWLEPGVLYFWWD